MSFVTCEGIMELIENLLAYAWPEESGKIVTPFKRMKYDEAMELYGIDKPDLRIPQRVRIQCISFSNLFDNIKNVVINISAQQVDKIDRLLDIGRKLKNKV